ncbi:MAG: hypothetical protein IPK76_04040 [Lewinellaceae bacterium]|jgi:hypothetical protein|nr:hypothetical protein [Lewinellaceae bacterium]
MRHFLARVLHIAIAFAVLLSSTGFVVNRHFCGNKMKRMAIFFKAGGCAHTEHAACVEGGHCKTNNKSAKRSCCQDKAAFHKLSQDQKNTESVGFSLKPPIAFAAIIPAIPSFAHGFAQAPACTFLRYKPPARYRKDVFSLLQVFRL